MEMDLFREMLEIDSTSGTERGFAEFLEKRLKTAGNSVERHEVGDGTLNLLFKWGEPEVYFCTHMDTVPPYIPPIFSKDRVLGRGTCDAKGQIFSMFSACCRLEEMGLEGFALLLLSGEETGSFGAKAWTRDCPGGKMVIVGEPTDNLMASAAKGTRAFEVKIRGVSCHSGYPSNGVSAVNKFLEFMDKIRGTDFPVDVSLGDTTWNIGKLVSDNPQNVLSSELTFRIYFRTTFASHKQVIDLVNGMRDVFVDVKDYGGDTPMRYYTYEGMPARPVSFGSDAPQLAGFERRALCGPGSVIVAHTIREYVLKEDLYKAEEQYIQMALKEIRGGGTAC